MTDRRSSREERDSLETRIGRLEDERGIRETLARYAFATDSSAAEVWVELWTEDGLYDFGDEDISVGVNGRIRGRAELLSFITGPNMPPAGVTQHYVDGPVIIKVDGDRAVAIGYSITIARSGRSLIPKAAGISRWVFVRTPEGWKIQERTRRELGATDQSSLFELHG